MGRQTHLRLWEEEESEYHCHDRNATKHPSDCKVDIVDHIRDGEIGHKDPHDVPCSPQCLRLLAKSGIGKLGPEEVRIEALPSADGSSA